MLYNSIIYPSRLPFSLPDRLPLTGRASVTSVSALQRDRLTKAFTDVDFREVDPLIKLAKQNLVGIPEIITRLRVVKSTPGSPDWEAKCFNSSIVWEYILKHLPNCGLDDMSPVAWKDVLVMIEVSFPVSQAGSTEVDFRLWRDRFSALADLGSNFGLKTALWIKGTKSGLGEAPSNKTSLESGYALVDVDEMAEVKLRFKAMMSLASKEMSTPKYLRETTRGQMAADRTLLNSVIRELVDDKILISLLTVQDLPNKRFSKQIASFSICKDLRTKTILLSCLQVWKKELVELYYKDPSNFDFAASSGKYY
jgi:hypothetical protein